jgi:hypothetical protein
MLRDEAARLRLLTDERLRLYLWMTLGLLAVRPFLEATPALLAIDTAFVVLLIAVVRKLFRSHVVLGLGLVLLALTMAARLARAFHAEFDEAPWISSLATLSSVLSCVFVAFVLFLLLVYVIRAPRLTHNTVLAAIVAYVLIAALAGFLYLIIYERDPGAFNIDLALGTAEVQLRYFSTTTLTTVGFGDIVPRSQAARAVAALEALCGQLYLAAIVARIIGLQVARASSQGDRAGADMR